MPRGMTKTQLVRHIAKRIGTNNKTAAALISTLSQTAVQETKKSGVFVLPGLGRLKTVSRKARMGRNPATGDLIKVAAKTSARFYVAKPVKEALTKKPPKKKPTYPGPLITEE